MPSQTQLQIRVTYDAPVFDCRRVLRILPLHRPNQKIVREAWKMAPTPHQSQQKADEFGNRRLFLYHRHIEDSFQLALELEVKTQNTPIPVLAHEKLGPFKMPSRAVNISPELLAVARQVRNQPALERANSLCRYCFESLEYTAQTSASPLQASEIFKNGIGTCADFTHVFLGLCRASGLAARYVAGFNPTEGQMHAWAEVLIEGYWHALDPTHGRELSAGSVAVAVGRDYYDCTPHLGTFRGNAQAYLSLYCQTVVRTDS